MTSVAAWRATMSEAEFQAAVVEAAQFQGWRVHFTPDWIWRLVSANMRRHPKRGMSWSLSGFPDLVLCRPPRVIFAELKSAAGHVRPTQKEWIADLAACGIEVRVWRPTHCEEIVRELQRRD